MKQNKKQKKNETLKLRQVTRKCHLLFKAISQKCQCVIEYSQIKI